MGPEEIRRVLGEQRRELADRLEDLADEQWRTPSLCAGWSVKDVLAHLTTPTRTSVPQVVRGAVTAGLSFDRMELRQARRISARFTPAELLAQLRETADSPRRMPGSAPMDPLVDVLVHAQDVARPLGRRLRTPPDLAVRGLDHVADSRFWGVPKRRQGLRLVATDDEWSLGNGPEVRGPAGSLLAGLLGRGAVLDDLTGHGAEELGRRLSARVR